MAESKHIGTIKTQVLVQEYCELKRVATEIPSMTQKTESLRCEIVSLEVKLSELEARLASKDSELKKSAGKFPVDIDTQIKILEFENSRLREGFKMQQTEVLKNEISQNLHFKSVYESSYKDILEKFYSKGQDTSLSSINNPLESEKNKLSMQLKKQEILLQEAINDRNYIKNEVLPVLEHTLHLYEKNKLELDSEIEGLEAKLKLPVSKKQDNIIYEEEEYDNPLSNVRSSRENSPTVSPKHSLQYSFISSNKFSVRPSSTKLALASPSNKFVPSSQIKSKKSAKLSK